MQFHNLMMGNTMNERNSTESVNNGIYPCSDPLGIKKIVLGGAPPSLHVEAQIAKRQWGNNGFKGETTANVGAEKEIRE